MKKIFGKISALAKFLLSQYIVRYAISSVIAFLIDYALTLLLNYLFVDVLHIKFGMEIAMLAAWLVSSNVNFNVNRYFVFRDSSPYFWAYMKYYGLAVFTFVFKSYVFIELLTRVCKLDIAIAKPIAETVMFVVTYIVQKLLVFTKKKKPGSPASESDAGAAENEKTTSEIDVQTQETENRYE